MKESELRIGDIIFFENRYKEGEKESYRYTDHVALFAGCNEKDEPMIIHNITSEYGHYHPEKLSGLCQTTLRALKNQLQREQGYPDVYYDVHYFVYRFAENDYAQQAVNILKNQAKYRIPYDEPRLKAKLALEEEKFFEDIDFKELGEKTYQTAGLYRAIKYTARLPLPLTRTRLDGVGRGLTCSMTVILAYQMAELLIKKLVIPSTKLDAQSNKWVSDKYGPIPDSASVAPSYLDYIHSLRVNADTGHEDTILSYHCWRDETSITTFTHDTFPVDSKTIGAAGLRLHIDENSNWKSLGELEVQQRHFDTKMRLLERRRRTESFQDLCGNLTLVTQSSPQTISRRPSNAPSPDSNRSAPWFSLTPPGSSPRDFSSKPASSPSSNDDKELPQFISEAGASSRAPLPPISAPSRRVNLTLLTPTVEESDGTFSPIDSAFSPIERKADFSKSDSTTGERLSTELHHRTLRARSLLPKSEKKIDDNRLRVCQSFYRIGYFFMNKCCRRKGQNKSDKAESLTTSLIKKN